MRRETKIKKQIVWIVAILAVVIGVVLVKHLANGTGRGDPSSLPVPSTDRVGKAKALDGPTLEVFPESIGREQVTVVDTAEDPERRGVAGGIVTTELGNFRVTVLDPWDRPVSAQVRARPKPPSIEAETSAGVDPTKRLQNDDVSVETDVDGIAELHLPISVPFRLEVNAWPSHFEPWAREWILADWGEIVARLTAKCGRITGRVTAADSGDPLDAATVSFSISSEGHVSSGMPLVQNGMVDFLVPSGVVHVEASAPGHERLSQSVPISPGEWAQVEFPLQSKPQAGLSGRVVESGGYPVAGARVSLAYIAMLRAGTRSWARQDIGVIETDVDGGFHYSNLGPGEHVLSVKAEGFEPTGSIPLDISLEGDEVEISLARAGTLRLRAVDAAGNELEPLRVILRQGNEIAVEVMLEPWGLTILRGDRSFRVYGAIPATGIASEYRETEKAKKDSEGFYVIEGVLPGEYELLLSREELKGQAIVSVANGKTSVAEVRLETPRAPR